MEAKDYGYLTNFWVNPPPPLQLPKTKGQEMRFDCMTHRTILSFRPQWFTTVQYKTALNFLTERD